MLTFKVDKQQIIRTDQNFIVENSRNYLFAAFVFSGDWHGIPKTVIFCHKGKTYHALLESTNELLVPATIIHEPGFSVGVIGGDLITTNTHFIKVQKSVCTSGSSPVPPEPPADIYTQIMESLGNKADGLRYQNGRLQLMAQGQPVGNTVKIDIGEGGATPEDLYVKDFLAADWTDRTLRQELRIPATEHALGYTVAVLEITRESDSGLGNVLCQTMQLPNGDISVTASERFGGRIILKGV